MPERGAKVQRRPRSRGSLLAGRVLSWIALVLAGITFALILLVALLPQTGAYTMSSQPNGTMGDTLPEGALVVARPVDPAALKEGNIIVYAPSQGPRDSVAQRIVSIDRTGNQATITVKGDADAPDADPVQVTYTGPAGEVITSLPGFGFVAAPDSVSAVRFALGAILLGCLALFGYATRGN